MTEYESKELLKSIDFEFDICTEDDFVELSVRNNFDKVKDAEDVIDALNIVLGKSPK